MTLLSASVVYPPFMSTEIKRDELSIFTPFFLNHAQNVLAEALVLVNCMVASKRYRPD